MGNETDHVRPEVGNTESVNNGGHVGHATGYRAEHVDANRSKHGGRQQDTCYGQFAYGFASKEPGHGHQAGNQRQDQHGVGTAFGQDQTNPLLRTEF